MGILESVRYICQISLSVYCNPEDIIRSNEREKNTRQTKQLKDILTEKLKDKLRDTLEYRIEDILEEQIKKTFRITIDRQIQLCPWLKML